MVKWWEIIGLMPARQDYGFVDVDGKLQRQDVGKIDAGAVRPVPHTSEF